MAGESALDRADDVVIVVDDVLDLVPDRTAGHGQRILVKQSRLAQMPEHHRQAAGIEKLLHQIFARRHQVDDGCDITAATVPVVERDIDDVSGSSRNPRLVRRFLHAYAQMAAQTANLNTIMKRANNTADDPDLPSRETGAIYLEALRRMMIVDEVPAWDPAVRSSKRLTTGPKRHLADPSLAAALLQMSSTRMLDDLETTGFLFESLVAHDLRIYAEAAGASCFHYREAEGRLEVDYILETRDGNWVGIEVKLGENELDKAAAALHRLAGRTARPPASLAIITGTSLAYTRPDGVHVIPLGVLGP